MTSAEHPTAQQSVCATRKTDLIYWDTPRAARSTFPTWTKHQVSKAKRAWQPFWWQATSLVRNFAVSCPETRQAVPMHETLRQAVKFAKYSQHTLADAPATNTCVRSETQWRQENAQEHREHCTTKPQTFSRVSLPRWKGVRVEAKDCHQLQWYVNGPFPKAMRNQRVTWPDMTSLLWWMTWPIPRE